MNVLVLLRRNRCKRLIGYKRDDCSRSFLNKCRLIDEAYINQTSINFFSYFKSRLNVKTWPFFEQIESTFEKKSILNREMIVIDDRNISQEWKKTFLFYYKTNSFNYSYSFAISMLANKKKKDKDVIFKLTRS